MKHLILRGFASALVLGLLATPLLANIAKPPSGTKLRLTVGQKMTIAVSGFGGCKFGVNTVGDGAVVGVMSKSGESKKQKVTIVGMAPGEQQVSITTTGMTKGCTGFEFSYDVIVDPSPKALSKAVGTLMKAAMATQKDFAKSTVKSACNEINAILKAIKSKDSPLDPGLAYDQILDVVIDAMSDLAFDADEALNSTFEDIWDLGTLADVVSMNELLTGLSPGGCGPWDKFEDRIQKEFDKAADKLFGKVKKAGSAIDKALKGDDDSLLAIIQDPSLLLGVSTPVPMPGGGVPVPDPPKPVTKSWTSAGRLSSSPTASLEIGGSAEPGGMVNVSIDGPGPAIPAMNVAVDPVNCSFKAEFGSLPPGVYAVTMSKGDSTTTFTVVVP